VSKVKTVHRCQQCGTAAPRWAGRCGACGAWNSLVEELDRVSGRGASHPPARAVPLAEVVADGSGARPTGVGELDRVLGGGLVPGSITLLGGEPGIGKSTLLQQMLAAVAATGRRVLLVSAEESAEQVRLRAERLSATAAGVWIVADTELSAVGTAVDEVAPGLLAVDSIQTVFDAEVDSAPGSVTQVRHCAHRLVQLAKGRRLATVLVGHVTKEGTLAGPRALEHVVDTVLSFEGDRHHALRLLRAVKHRFGATGELGVFEMGEGGLAGVPDAGARFLADRRPGVPGSAVVPAVEGRRPLVVEVQALVAKSPATVPRRSAEGLDAGRLALLAAVLQERAGVPLLDRDVYALAAGGVRVVEPAVDLALALAVASAQSGVALPADAVACGEVGLGGELRRPAQLDRRLSEADRLGFRRAIIPTSAPDPPGGMTAIRAATLAEAVTILGLATEAT
jgi:DNA repair protein RadA/Sms